MKRYQFPLATVLRVRKVQEDQAVAALAAARRRQETAETAAERRVEAHRAGRPVAGVGTVEELLAARDRQERSARAVVAANQEVTDARGATVAGRAALASAASARRALEQLDERRRAEHALETQREETAEVDDLVTGRHRREHA